MVEDLHLYRTLSCNLVRRLRVDLAVLHVEKRRGASVEKYLRAGHFRCQNPRGAQHRTLRIDGSYSHAENRHDFPGRYRAGQHTCGIDEGECWRIGLWIRDGHRGQLANAIIPGISDPDVPVNVRCQSGGRIQCRVERRSVISGEIGHPSACHRVHHAVGADHPHSMIPAVSDEQVAPGVESETRGRVELCRRRGGFIPRKSRNARARNYNPKTLQSHAHYLMIHGIGNEEIAAWVGSDAARCHKCHSIYRSTLAQLADPLISVVAKVERAVRCNEQRPR